MSGDALWAFSLAVYAQPGVAGSCLALQDRHGLDVNLLLACLWLAARGVALPRAALAEAMEAAEPLAAAVRPLRAARRALKPVPGEAAQRLRATVKAAELEAERLEQHAIAAALPAAPGSAAPRAAAHANLNALLAALRIAPDEADKRALAALAKACL